MESVTVFWWEPALLMMVGVAFGYYFHAILGRHNLKAAGKNAEDLVQTAMIQADVIKKEAQVNLKDESIKIREQIEREYKKDMDELKALKTRISEREVNLDRRVDVLDRKETSIEEKLKLIDMEKEALHHGKRELDQILSQERDKLQEISLMSQDQAREQLMRELESELESEKGALIRKMQDEAKATAEHDARNIITAAIERYASSQVNEITTSTVPLPTEEMKGRIIGKEGRNIRSLESSTGVNILIDDTPEVVVISGFDPVRREVARISLERLMADGRIHPARIEEVVTEVQAEIDETIRKSGEAAIIELNLQGVAPELMRTVGKLKYRHSYGQNILKHSIEMGHIMGVMAGQLDLDVSVAKRCGLFHDIGKALDHGVEGSHAIIGADLLKKYGEEQVVCNAVASHHHDVEPESLYAHLVMAADAMTAARAGARSESTELYLKRLEQLEEIATSFRGVEKCYAIQAGREIRVIVEPRQINDNEAMQMARNISKQIEEQMTYPGQIKVTVLRETRCVEYAK